MEPQELERRRAELEQAQQQADRDFHDRLGGERDDVPCRAPGCSRGAVLLSAFCRKHHYEANRRVPCPFDHELEAATSSPTMPYLSSDQLDQRANVPPMRQAFAR
jgi:hypothetical protein